MLVQLRDTRHAGGVEAAGDGAGVVQLQSDAVVGPTGRQALHRAHRDRLPAQTRDVRH